MNKEDKKTTPPKVNSSGRPLIDPMEFDKDSPYYVEPEKKLINPLVVDALTKSVEDKIFIVLLKYDEGDGNDDLFDGQYHICTGRTETYRYIEKLVQAFGTDINAHESKVITETKQTETESGEKKYYLIDYDDAISVYTFCKAVEENYEGFRIDDFFTAPPADYQEPMTVDNVASRFMAAIDDPVIAKAAIDTYRELHPNKVVLDPPQVKDMTEKFDKPFSAKEEFPGLFEDSGDGSVNV